MASASCCNRKAKAVMPIMVVMLLYMLASCTVQGSGKACQQLITCPEEPLVYPYWSLCYSPAVYFEELYEFESVGSEGAGSYLAPEWDESNSTYYVRLSEEAAKYRLVYVQSTSERCFVAQKDDVVIQNADSGRILAWRLEGEDEYFLVEVDVRPGTSWVTFQFSQYEGDIAVSLFCPFIYPAVCQVYNILAYSTSAGLAAYSEEGAIYFKRSSENLLPFALRRSNSTVQSEQPAIKSVVAA